MRDFRWIGALALAALLLLRPGAASQGAARAMAQWCGTVAPAVFPFLALMPLITGEAAARAYRRLPCGWMARLFNLPGEALPALVVGMVAGSPAGAIAARRAAACPGMTRGQLRRLAAALPGFSPAFLLGGIGAGMLGSAAAGRLLLRAQLLTQLAMLALLRGAWRDDAEPVPHTGVADEEPPMRGAVLSVLAIGGWMALFGALAGVVRSVAGGAASDALLCVLDVPSGAQRVCAMPLAGGRRLMLLAAMCGFGGVCMGMQNLSALRGCGMRAADFFALRLLAAWLGTLFAALQLCLPGPAAPARPASPLALSALAAAALAVPVLIRLRKSIN